MKINRKVLISLLAPIVRVLNKHADISLQMQKGTLSVFATTDDYTLSHDLEIDCDENWITQVNGKHLMKYCKQETQDIISLVPLTGHIGIQIGKYKFESTVVEYPRHVFDDKLCQSITVASTDMQVCLDGTKTAMAKGDPREYLNTMLFETCGDKLQLVATDGHSLGMITMPNVVATEIEQGRQLIIKRSAILALAARIKGKKAETLEIEFSKNEIRFTDGRWSMVSLIIHAKYPDYKKVLVGDVYETKVSITTAGEYLKAINLVESMSKDNNYLGYLKFTKDEVSVSTEDCSEIVPHIDYQGVDVTVKMDLRIYIKALKAIESVNTCDQIDICIVDKTKLSISPHGATERELTWLVMGTRQ